MSTNSVTPKEIDTVEHFNLVTKLTRKMEEMTDRIDRKKMASLMAQRDPVKTMDCLYDTFLK